MNSSPPAPSSVLAPGFLSGLCVLPRLLQLGVKVWLSVSLWKAEVVPNQAHSQRCCCKLLLSFQGPRLHFIPRAKGKQQQDTVPLQPRGCPKPHLAPSEQPALTWHFSSPLPELRPCPQQQSCHQTPPCSGMGPRGAFGTQQSRKRLEGWMTPTLPTCQHPRQQDRQLRLTALGFLCIPFPGHEGGEQRHPTRVANAWQFHTQSCSGNE